MHSSFLFLDIHTQINFFDPKGDVVVAKNSKFLQNLERLTSHALKRHIPLLAALEVPPVRRDMRKAQTIASFFRLPSKKIQETAVSKALTIGTQEKHIDLTSAFLHHDQVIIETVHFDFFFNPLSSKILQKLQPQVCVCYGVGLDYGFEKTVLRLLKEQFPVLIPVDAVAPIHEENRESVLKELRAAGAAMWNTDFIIENT